MTLSLRSSASVGSTALNHYVTIAADGQVMLYSPLADMGQGIYTTLPMIIAEELDLDWRPVQLRLAPTDEAFGNPARSEQYAADSKSVRGYFLPLRRLGATARHLLMTAAADRWGVRRAELQTRNARVIHRPSGRELAYRELVEAAAVLPVPSEVTLKRNEEFRLLGKPMARRDVRAKTLGSLRFGIDVMRPGMRYAAIRQVPVPGARIRTYRLPDAAGLDESQVFSLDDAALVAVAGNTWTAQRAVDSVLWELDYSPPAAGDSQVAGAGRNRLALEQAGVPARGQLARAADDTQWDFVREYEVPMLAHAAMEPLACVADWDGRSLAVWASVQGPPRALSAIAAALALPADRVTVHQVFMGGSFGRRAETDFVVQAARIAHRIGGAVKLTWSRPEDMQHDFYRPSYAARIEATLDERGRLDGVRAKVAGESIIARRNPKYPGTIADNTAVGNLFQDGYRIPRLERRFVRVPQPVRVGFWRSVSSSMNAYFSETFINEVAAERAVDPIEYRLSLISDDARATAVLNRVRELSGWGASRQGIHQGMAFCMPYESYLAQVVDIEMLTDETFRVARIHTVVDCGFALDPLNVRSQIEGATLFGLTAAAYGEISLRDGQVTQKNFDTYRVVRLRETPLMETLIVASEQAPGGVGEIGVAAIAPALAGALHAASGSWPRRLPLERSGFRLA